MADVFHSYSIFSDATTTIEWILRGFRGNTHDYYEMRIKRLICEPNQLQSFFVRELTSTDEGLMKFFDVDLRTGMIIEYIVETCITANRPANYEDGTIVNFPNIKDSYVCFNEPFVPLKIWLACVGFIIC